MIFDLHNDIITERPAKARKFIAENKVILAVWGTYLSRQEALRCGERAKRMGHAAFEDISFTDTPEELAAFEPAYCSLTWNFDNIYAGGALENGELTDKGRKTIELFNSRKICLDTAHLNRQSFFEVADIADRVLCSHTCFEGVRKHPRNLTDEQIKLLIEKNGIIGLTFVSEFLNENKKATPQDVVNHIDYFAQKFGIDNLAIGTDFYGTNPIKHLRNYDDDFLPLKELLKIKNYSDSAINQIFFDNANNFFRR